MLKFAANLSMLYTEEPFIERYRLAAEDGFAGVECLFPYAEPAERIQQQLHAYALEQDLFNIPPGDWEAGERGIACLPGRQHECMDAVKKALDYAYVLGTKQLHLMAGIQPSCMPEAKIQEQYLETVAAAADLAAKAGINILIEPINTINMPNYFLRSQAQAHSVLNVLRRDNLKVQMDLFHCQRSEGDVSTKLAKYLPTGRIAHLQIAGVPERHEPDTGELNYDFIFNQLEQLSYAGWIGCEYQPKRTTREGLVWFINRKDELN